MTFNFNKFIEDFNEYRVSSRETSIRQAAIETLINRGTLTRINLKTQCPTVIEFLSICKWMNKKPELYYF